MDVGLNKPFKNWLREQALSCLVNKWAGKQPKRKDVAAWIKASWERVSAQAVQNTWRKIGYTNHPNGIDSVVIDERSDDDTSVGTAEMTHWA